MIEQLLDEVRMLPPHEEVKISKQHLREVPSYFKPTMLGGFKMGMIAQYRYNLFHLYEFSDYWTLHRDLHNPEVEPIKHLIHDAPQIIMAMGIGIVGLMSIVGTIWSQKSH